MVTPRKYTWENNRVQSVDVLLMYEAGKTPKEISQELGIGTDVVWQRIKHGRKWRSKLETAE